MSGRSKVKASKLRWLAVVWSVSLDLVWLLFLAVSVSLGVVMAYSAAQSAGFEHPALTGAAGFVQKVWWGLWKAIQ